MCIKINAVSVVCDSHSVELPLLVYYIMLLGCLDSHSVELPLLVYYIMLLGCLDSRSVELPLLVYYITLLGCLDSHSVELPLLVYYIMLFGCLARNIQTESKCRCFARFRTGSQYDGQRMYRIVSSKLSLLRYDMTIRWRMIYFYFSIEC